MDDHPDSGKDSRRDDEERESAPEENPRCPVCGVPEGAPHIKSMHEKETA